MSETPSVVIRIINRIDFVKTPVDGEYVVNYDPTLISGTYTLETSPDVEKAKKFSHPAKALEYWRKVCPNDPVRPWDGKPNRPLTAYTVVIDAIDRITTYDIDIKVR